MTHQQRVRLAQRLSSFVDAHRGTRRGQLFGRPAAFAGVRVFAEITDDGFLACRLSATVARRSVQAGTWLHPASRPGWVVSADRIANGPVDRLLELAAANVASEGRLPDRLDARSRKSHLT